MTFHTLTAILVVLKALNYIDWSWWLVLAPSIFTFVMGTVVLICAVFITAVCK